MAQPASAPRTQARPAAPASNHKARPAQQKAQAPAPAPEKAKGKTGPILIVGGLAVGGVLAWVLMNVL